MTRNTLLAILILLVPAQGLRTCDAKSKKHHIAADDGTSSEYYFAEFFPKVEVPAEVKQSPIEFKAWAMGFNQFQQESAVNRYKQSIEAGKFAGADGLRTSSGTKTASRHTGVGMNGFGGPGGYTGRGDIGSGLIGGGYGMGGYGGRNGLGGSGGGINGYGNSETTSNTHGLSYTVHWKDLNDNGGGTIYIINPYCWDYWSK